MLAIRNQQQAKKSEKNKAFSREFEQHVDTEVEAFSKKFEEYRDAV
jgi:hypothetical protein